MIDYNSGFPIPKYKMGDIVFSPSTYDITENLPCPDCLDSGKWSVTTPVGETFEVSCQRCRSAWGRIDTPALVKRVWVGKIQRLTVGQIRIEWPNENPDRSVIYMCEETGVGSGRLHYEPELFTSSEQCQVKAEEQAFKQTEEYNAKPREVRDRDISTLTIRNAFAEQAAGTCWSVAYHFNQLRERVTGWLEKDDHDRFDPSSHQIEMIQMATNFENPWGHLDYHLDGKNNPLVELVQAARLTQEAHSNTLLSDALRKFSFIPDRKTLPEEIV